jgi:hypothetical protein
MVFFDSSICNAYLVGDTEILWYLLVDSLQFCYFFIYIRLIPGEYEQCIHVLRVDCQDFLSKIHGLGFLYPFVLINQGNAGIGIE